MKKSAWIWLVVIIAAIGLVAPSSAYIKKMAQVGMPFLTIDSNARTAAMGGASVCIANGASALFANPANMVYTNGLDLSLSRTSWIADINQITGAAAINLGTYGSVGISLVWMDYGAFKETVPYSGYDVEQRKVGYELLGDFTTQEYAIGLSYARKISSMFSFGAQAKYAMEDLYHDKKFMIFDQRLGREVESSIKEQVFAFDIGTMYYTGWKDLRFGMAIRNFSRQGKFVQQRFELPLTMTMGMAMDVLSLVLPPESKQHLTVTVDALHPRNWTERVHAGAEYSMFDVLFIRGGYKFNYDEESWTAGLGVRTSLGGNHSLELNYAHAAFGEFFGNVQRLSVGFTF